MLPGLANPTPPGGGMGGMPGLANGLMTPQMGMPMRHMAGGGIADDVIGKLIDAAAAPQGMPPGPSAAGAAPGVGAPAMAYGGFAHGGMSGAEILRRAQLGPAMTSPPYSIAAGLVDSLVPGRTDQLPLDVPENSYVIPADVVSALGQGNTKAGAALLEGLFSKGQFSAGTSALGLASGGHAAKAVPVVVAGGEVFVAPHQVLGVGRKEMGGRGTHEQQMTAGHKALDRMVLKVRAQAIKHLKKLPGPKK